MTYKLPIVVANKLLYCVKCMNEAIKLNPPKTFSEAKLLLNTFEVITSEAIAEAESELPTLAAA